MFGLVKKVFRKMSLQERDRQDDPIFFIGGFTLIILGLLFIFCMGGYMLYEIICQGKNFPSNIKLMALLSGVLIVTLGVFLLSLVYTDSEEEKKLAKKMMFPDG